MARSGGFEAIVRAAVEARTWDERVATMRTIPERFGTAQQQAVYAAIADRFYAPKLTAEFAYVYWRDEYELALVEAAYKLAHDSTQGFVAVEPASIARTIRAHPKSLQAFRLLLGLIAKEFAEACSLRGGPKLGGSRIRSIERGAAPSAA